MKREEKRTSVEESVTREMGEEGGGGSWAIPYY